MPTAKNKPRPGYVTLMVFTVLMTLGAILTFIPAPYANTESPADYKSHFTFARLSTVLSLVAAGGGCIVRNRLFTTRPRPRRRRRTERYAARRAAQAKRQESRRARRERPDQGAQV